MRIVDWNPLTPLMPGPVPSSLPSLLSRCADLGRLRCGTTLHASILKAGTHHTDCFLGNAIVNLYARCGRLAEAGRAFDEIRSRGIGSWNCLVNGHPDDSRLVLRLLRRMRSEEPHVLPNSFTFTGVFAAVSRSPHAGGGPEVHAVAIKTGGCGDIFVGSSLLNMYCKLGQVSEARKVFDRMPVRNSVTWAAMISGYANDKCAIEAFALFSLVSRDDRISVNEFVLTSVLSAFTREDSLRMGEQVHCFAVKNGLFSFVPVKNSLLTVYAKCGLLHDALTIFESTTDRSSITWSAMVTGFAQNGSFYEALRLFSEMHRAGVMPSEYTFVGVLNACSDCAALMEGKQIHVYLLKLGFESQLYTQCALVDMYAKCNVVLDARKGFDQITKGDTVLWTTMISGYVQNGQNEEALNLYGRMGAEGTSPNDLTLASILRACSNLGNLELGRQIHVHAIKHSFSLETPIGSALLTMYAKCADLNHSHLVFRRMPTKDVVAWNSTISAFAQNGQGRQALQLFDEMVMKGAKPNHVTFINLLAACSHMGLVDRGWNYFRAMTAEYGLIPDVEHYACMVDILSRAGMLDEAKTFIESAQVDHGTCLWRILLGACANYRRYDLGAYAGERLLALGTQDSSAYILLSNIYAAYGKREDIEQVRRTMTLRGVNKEPGCSWIEINNRVHVFLVKDQQHPEIKQIYEEARRLGKHMKDEDYHIFTGSSLDGFFDSNKAEAEKRTNNR